MISTSEFITDLYDNGMDNSTIVDYVKQKDERIAELEAALLSAAENYSAEIDRASELENALDKIWRRLDANDCDEWTLYALKNIAFEAINKRGEG